MNSIKTICLAILLFASVSSYAQKDYIDTVLARYTRLLLQQHIPDSQASRWVHTINVQGQWPDVQYDDTSRANWKTALHLQHIRNLAIAWQQPHTTWYHQPQLIKVMNTALDHWLQKRYKNSNWWHNQIGVPQYMRDIIILLRDTLSPERFKQSMEVLAQHRVNGTGANLTWSADLGLHYGALSNDTAMMTRCAGLISNEIRVSPSEGVQPDYSFHQHGNRLQMYSYGEAFLKDNIRLAWELRNTPWAYSIEKINILTGFVLEGWQWMARGINTVPGTVDRAASRPGSLHNPDIRSIIPLLMELEPGKAVAFRQINNRQEGSGASLQGLRYFPYSDFTAYQQPDFSFFLKTISTRTLHAESINSENLQGRLMNSGDGYVIQNGNEYYNLMPVWNWDYLPGITNFTGSNKIVQLPFTGGVTNGLAGITVMDYALTGKDSTQALTAKKSWIFHNNKVICLIAGLQTKQIKEAPFTVLDQCRRQTNVVVNAADKMVKEGDHTLQKVRWLHHNQIAYILLQPATVRVQLQPATGSWFSINKSQPATPVTENVFLASLVHAKKETSCGYIIAHCPQPQQVQQIINKPDWKVVSNTANCQAVEFDNGDVMAAFWSYGSLQLGGNRLCSVNKPCVIMLSGNTIYASDPSHTGYMVNFSLNGKIYNVILPADGSTVRVTQ